MIARTRRRRDMSAEREPWPTLDELLREESDLELAGLSETDAYELGMLAVAAATEQRLPVSVGCGGPGVSCSTVACPGRPRTTTRGCAARAGW
ncbi:hypothetical protein NKG94_14660 [Micromonospora sp. M12]